MGIKFANNAATALNGSIDASTTTIVVDDGSVFPTLGGGDHCYATVEDEIVKITAIATNTLTVVRAQDGTLGAAHDNNVRIEQRINAASLNDLSDEHDSLAEMSGDLDDIADGTTYVKMTAAQSTKLDGIEAGADVTDATNVAAAGALMTTGGTMTGNVSFGDNDKAIFGAGSDLQIYHDGLHSRITDAGTGYLSIDTNGSDIRLTSNGVTEFMAKFEQDGPVTLYYDTAPKLATTSTGIDVTGTVTADGLTVDSSSIALDATAQHQINMTAYNGSQDATTRIATDRQAGTGSESLMIFYANDGASLEQKMRIRGNGDISFYEATGNTPKLVWKAGDERLGIGTDSPDRLLHIESSAPIFCLTNPQTTSTLGLSMGKIEWETRDASAAGVIGYIDVVDSNNFGTTFDMAFATGQSGSATERMRIDSSGNVGIGTSSPSRNLHIHKAAADSAFAIFTNSTTGSTDSDGLRIGVDANGYGYIYHGAARHIAFGTSNTERMRIDSSGNLLLNGASSGTSGGGTWFENPNNSTMPTYLRFKKTYSGAREAMDFRYSGTQVGRILFDNTSTSYNTSSDYRLKTDVQPMTGATERLKALKPVNFEWISTGERVDGFLAHEAQEVVPEAVTGTKDAMTTESYEVTPAVLDDDGNVVTEAVMGEREVPDYQGIDQSKLTPLLTVALQEAIAKIEQLEDRIAALEN